jgi:hypothetical protein
MIKPEFDRKRIEKSLESTPGGERSKALFNGSGHFQGKGKTRQTSRQYVLPYALH